jgi:hypothetical protein
MAGAIEKKINETKADLVGSPLTHIDARAAILSDIALSREFAHTFLQGLCLGHTGGKDEAGDAVSKMSLHTVAKALAKQRMICYGAHTISTTYKKFSLPSHESVNGALTLTEANTSFFGYVATDLTETNTITLSTSATANQTIDGNTFSTYVGNYYMVRSRVSGELESTSGNVSAYTTPDGGDIVFGNAIAWSSNSADNQNSGELTANTWNYHWARANIASVAITNSGTPTQLNTLTLSDHLTAGSNTNYTPVGPGFNQKFYLKRHADSVNTFTITGTTTTDSVVVTAISAADILKIKYNDVISGTGISGAPTIAAVQATDSQLRLSTAATANGTVTITVNSVPFGHAAHDIFCQVEVSGEGLVANSTWTPVGNDAGTYASNSEDDLCTANTSQFIALLGFFNPGNASSSDLIKGASGLYSSSGKAYGARAGVGNYRALLEDGRITSASTDNVSTEGFLLIDSSDGSADAGDNILTEEYVTSTGAPVEDTGFSSGVEDNPFKPANQGTTTAFALKEGEMSGTQPDGLTDKDVYVGRFVAWNKDRTKMSGTASVADHEYRYITDSAEKFFYAPGRGGTYRSGITEVAGENLPGVGGAGSESEPRAVLPRTGMSTITNRVITVDSTGSWGGNTATDTVPQDDAIVHATTSGTGVGPTDPAAGGVAGPPASGEDGDRSGSIGSFYVLESNNFITLNHVQASISVTANSTATNYVLSYANQLDGQFACYYNFVQQHVNGSSDSEDYAFVKATATALTAVDNFRDPVLYNSTGTPSYDNAFAGGGISDLDFDGRAADFTANTVVAEAALSQFVTDFGNSSRGAKDGTGSPARGTAVNFASLTGSKNGVTGWEGVRTSCTTLGTDCGKRVVEIDARIGVPVYANSSHASGTTPATRGNPPCIRVKTIPAANTTNGYVPYGREIYNNINLLLGQDVDLLGGIMKDIESLTDLVGLVKNARNKYEIYNGRVKEY